MATVSSEPPLSIRMASSMMRIALFTTRPTSMTLAIMARRFMVTPEKNSA